MKQTPLFLLLSLLAVLAFSRCNDNHEIADVILKGHVRTMEHDDANKLAECVAIRNGRIIFTGNFEEAKVNHYKEGTTQIVEYGDSALIMPAFVDAHAHVGLAAMTLPMADLAARPYGNVNDSNALVQAMQDYLRKNNLPDSDTTTVLIGNNYDDAQLAGNQQPTRFTLDRVSTTHPIYIMHVSGHMGVANTRFLNMMGIHNNTPPGLYAGGTIVKTRPQNSKDSIVTGLLLENANVHAMEIAMEISQKTAASSPAAKQAAKDSAVSRLLQAEYEWFKYGVTTICEGRAGAGTIELIAGANDADILKGDFIVLPDYDQNSNLGALKDKFFPGYYKHMKVPAVKFTFDGSPQGRDAYLSQPYLHPPIGQNNSYKGTPIYAYADALRKIDSVATYLDMPVHVHCNGDAAIDMVLNIFNHLKKQKNAKTGKSKLAHNIPNVIIHCQITRPEQLDSMKKLAAPLDGGTMPLVMESFFPTHVYLWGDWYKKEVLGTPRCNRIAPLGEAARKGLRYTIHTDAPITPPDLLTAVYAAVNRKTLDGDTTLGPDQRIPVYDALKAITTEAAYQWGEDTCKGKLVKGYKADIVVLSHDPVKVNPQMIRDAVKIMYTFKDGKQVYPALNNKQTLTQRK
ncbi:amidohydrolase [Chitinophaga qingshengii]|uniref:Amidohydrolase n=1 Tax=Chitinophaga qingshengii TaxID=1569794 RepID=A0ABR7TTB2_9BACT|nr:amidohydrolase [Chitinophaga qingshengii]MBC9932848.1 amidohydrolase [Chitinophaga qingshengii]